MDTWICQSCGELSTGEHCSKCLGNRPAQEVPVANAPGSYGGFLGGPGLANSKSGRGRMLIGLLLLLLVIGAIGFFLKR